jgi:hypothetical protein
MGVSGSPRVLRDVIEIVADLVDIQALIVTTTILPEPVNKVSDRVLLTAHVPAHLVNPLADIAITHGGAGTVQTAIHSATPLVGRIYPMLYLRKKGTTTTLEEVGELVSTGPYSWVRHPQYTSGMVMLIGWFLVWGALYTLGLIPLIGGIIYTQALIEEKYILEKKFGREYVEYSERVGMLIPRVMRGRSESQ